MFVKHHAPPQRNIFERAWFSLIHLGVKAKGSIFDLDLWQMTLINVHQWHVLTYQTWVLLLGEFWSNREMFSFYVKFCTDWLTDRKTDRRIPVKQNVHQWHVLTYQTWVLLLGEFWSNREMFSFYVKFCTDWLTDRKTDRRIPVKQYATNLSMRRIKKTSNWNWVNMPRNKIPVIFFLISSH